jgi:CubicO group peptidase (beta-lactamase class C family)
MRFSAVLAWALAAALTSLSCGTTATVEPDVASRLDAFFTGLHDRGLFSGAVVVGNERGIVWERGFGSANIERQAAFTPDTPGDGASLAKTFTAALVLMLQREGLVDLDAPVQRLLPELPYPEITLRHLLTHSAGIPVGDYDDFDRLLPPDQPRTTGILLAALAGQKPPLAFRPGTAFEYSSFGYDLAALAAARAAGNTYTQLLEERFFRPLGITSAYVRPARLSEFPGIRTLGYRSATSADVHDVFDLEGFHGGSNIYISARDLHRWNVSMMREKQPGGLKPAAPLNLGSWYVSADGTALSYAGHLQGFHSEVYRDVRRGRSVVYVSNNTLDPWLQHSIIRTVNAILDGRAEPELFPTGIDEIRRGERESLAGRWLLPGPETVTIETSQERVSITRNGVSYPVFQVNPRAFYAPGLDFMMGFSKDPAGRPAKIYISTNFDERWGTKL